MRLRVAMLLAVAGVMTSSLTVAQTEYKVSQPSPPGYGKKPSFGTTKIVVSDMDRALHFYQTVLGMKESMRYVTPAIREIMLKYEDSDPGEPTLVLVKYPDNRKIELGSAYGYLLFVTPDIRSLMNRIREGGFTVKREPQESKQLGIIVAFAEDPDGRPIELVEMLQK